jgi:alpha-tubulin suppressor-like RCC1 family protein
MRALRVSIVAGTLFGVGCAAVIGADFGDGHLRPDRDGGAHADEAGLADAPDREASGTPPPVPPVGGKCDADRKLCDGLCFSLGDPQHGCAAAACDPCPAPPSGTLTCADGKCAVDCGAGLQRCGGTCCAPTPPPTVPIAGGAHHACALTAAGGVRCWGDNAKGQLGNDSTQESHVPVDVVGLSSGVVALAAGESHSCAITSAGTVKCWGANAKGQLGNGSVAESHVPVEVTALGVGNLAVAASWEHTCAVTAAGGVKCWGANDVGQLGDDTTNESHVPVDVFGLGSGMADVSARFAFTCARATVGTVSCWGYDLDGELGTSAPSETHRPVEIAGLGGAASSLSSGADAICAVVAGGVRCWGSNYYGQLGSGGGDGGPTPVSVIGLDAAIASVRAGYSYMCGLTSGGGVKCWGDNFGLPAPVPADVTGLAPDVTAIGAGWFFTCARASAGGVQCWGNGQNGELGNNSTSNTDTPRQVVGLP